jgi:hypothetical protein
VPPGALPGDRAPWVQHDTRSDHSERDLSAMAAQLCNLPYSELNELSGRLFVLAEYTLGDRQAAADMRNAARAVSDLASLRFALEELAADCDARTALKLQELIGREAAAR